MNERLAVAESVAQVARPPVCRAACPSPLAPRASPLAHGPSSRLGPHAPVAPRLPFPHARGRHEVMACPAVCHRRCRYRYSGTLRLLRLLRAVGAWNCVLCRVPCDGRRIRHCLSGAAAVSVRANGRGTVRLPWEVWCGAQWGPASEVAAVAASGLAGGHSHWRGREAC